MLYLNPSMPVLEENRFEDKEPQVGGSILISTATTAEDQTARYDLYCLDRTILDISDAVTLFGEGSGGELNEQKLGLDVNHITECIAGHQGSWLIGSESTPLAPELYKAALYSDYSLDNFENDTNRSWLNLPAGAVTAARALVGKVTSTSFKPVVDVRIRTSADAPTYVYDSSRCNLQAVPSDGHWFRFKLVGLGLHLPEAAGAR